MTKSTRDLLISFFGIIALAAMFVAAYYASGVSNRHQTALQTENNVAPPPPVATSTPPNSEPKSLIVFGRYYSDPATSIPNRISGYIDYNTDQAIKSARIIFSSGLIRPLDLSGVFNMSSDNLTDENRNWDIDVTGLFSFGENKFKLEATLADGKTISQDMTLTVAGPPENSVNAALDVRWLSQSAKVNIREIVDAKKLDELKQILSEQGATFSETGALAYRSGTVRGGAFDGYTLYIFKTGECYEMGCGTAWYRALKKSSVQKLSYVNQYSEPIVQAEANLFDEQLPNVRITAISRPSTFLLNGVTMRRYIYGFDSGGGEAWFDEQNLVPIATHPEWGTVYTDTVATDSTEKSGKTPINAFYLRLPDNRTISYTFNPPFMSRDRKIPQITWLDGSKNTADYQTGDFSGCGGFTAFAVRSESFVQPATRLSRAGTTNTGDPVYIIKDVNDPELKEMYQNFYGYVPEGGERLSYAEFITRRPIFYWKDPFGRWNKFTRADAQPAAECGKPVIYLYPQKATSVRVQVGLKGKMTASEPTYGSQGWSVVAQPDGFVRNVADGRLYPNLYWEGVGVRYATPNEGFVLKTSDADSWLRATLATIGFTDRENREFREFWVPRMPQTPYTFITFASQDDFDRDAPLRISPKPDVVNRVFMITRGLDAPKVVPPLKLPTINRRGFAVVEWGGELRK